MEPQGDTIFIITTYIYRIFTSLFLIIGTVTNILSAIVYSRKKMRKTSYSVYLFALAIVDLCVTINGNTRIFLMAFEFDFLKTNQSNLQKSFDSYSNQKIFKGIDIRETSLVACRTHRFLTYFFLQLSSVILCLLSIDRFFGCVLVLKSSRFCKPSIARKIILICIVFLVLFNAHFLGFMGFEMPINDETNSSKIIQCYEQKDSGYYSLIWGVYFYLDSLIYCIVPFIIMITCNISIITKIISSRIRSKQVIISKKKNQNVIAKNSRSMLATEKRISIILIVISLSFFIFTLPVFIMENLISEKKFESSPGLELALALSYMLMYSNHVINFFFYCSLGPSFRKEVKKLFPFLFFVNNKIDPVKVSRYNTAQFGASTSANPKRFISKGDISTYNKSIVLNPNPPKQSRLIVSFYKTTKIEEENSIRIKNTETELQVLYTDKNISQDMV
ncbi:unnamed protein product [Brachionus calyciflorus]|uniref:G-protein coupled receptors family 1 profile domain-containing protein n=1 Tax=Brachionus calyciflorus TaxID=104777 RepID=A0A813SD96_9BILA|nr:unnamed protein product [Brachionus calyciflorus]